MGERALGWSLKLLEVALLVGPILIAFAAHGWDFGAVVMPSPNPMEKLRLETPQVGQVGAPTKVGEYVWEATASFTSPFDFAFSIEDFRDIRDTAPHNTEDFHTGELNGSREDELVWNNRRDFYGGPAIPRPVVARYGRN